MIISNTQQTQSYNTKIKFITLYHVVKLGYSILSVGRDKKGIVNLKFLGNLANND